MNAHILFKYIHNECDPEEAAQVQSWLAASPRNREIYQALVTRKQALESAATNEWEKTAIDEWEKMQQMMAATLATVTRRPIIRFYRYAAIAAAVTGITATVLLLRRPEKQPAALFTIYTDAAARKKVQLPDGSTVWLQYQSALTYDTAAYNKDTRALSLQGDAFFEVAPAPGKPFMVKVSGLDVQVLGTSFFVKNRPGHQQEISVATGKISVTAPRLQIRLTRNQRVVYEPATGKSRIDTVSSGSITAARENKLVFENATLAEMADILSDWYNIKVIVSNNHPHTHSFTGTITDDGMKQVLDGLGYLAGFTYTLQPQAIIIHPKQ